MLSTEIVSFAAHTLVLSVENNCQIGLRLNRHCILMFQQDFQKMVLH